MSFTLLHNQPCYYTIIITTISVSNGISILGFLLNNMACHSSLHSPLPVSPPLLKIQFAIWPIIGNPNLIGSLPHQSIHDLFEKYGPIMQLKFGSFLVVVIVVGEYTTYNYFDITWLCVIELFSAKRLESYEYIQREEMNLWLKGLYESSNIPTIFKDYISNLSLNVISRIVIGENEIVTPNEFKEMLEELFPLNGVLDIGDSIPWLRFLDLCYNKRTKALSKKFDIFLEHVLDEHNDPNLDVKLERYGVRDNFSTVIVKWAILEMLKKLEIDKERWGIVNLPYIDSIAKETMRLHLVAPMLVPHQTCEHCQVVGYDILKCTRALVNVWTNRRDLKVWENPNEFWLQKFIGKTIDSLPFGAGRKINVIKYLNMEEIFGLSTPKKYPLEVVAVPRLPIRMNSH
ncbi:hypothetical protein GOBAR_DD00168 [Gossypium barbadense]|nr:hypothetical protein GOBAR_DD00168 [Gossypium barbadense]